MSRTYTPHCPKCRKPVRDTDEGWRCDLCGWKSGTPAQHQQEIQHD